MSTSIRQSVSLCALAISLWGVATPMAAQAQEIVEPENGEIVVTARRGEEALLDVPASVSVITEETLTAAGITTTEQIANLVPGVTIVTNTAEVGDTQIAIRGINGARDAESNVALVVDGILKTNTSILNQNQGDLTQMEILKGPQGAYYGRNAIAGAIVIQTRKPTDTLEVRGRASYGNNDSYSGFVSISGPISDGAGFVLSGDYRHTDGFFRNTGPIPEAQGATVDQFRSYNFSGRVITDIGDSGNLDLKARYSDVRSGSINYNVVFALPNFAGLNPAFFSDVNALDYRALSNIPSDGQQETFEASGKLDYDFDKVRLSIWGAYTDVKQDLIADAATAAFGFFNGTPECRASVAQLNAAGVTLPPPLVLGEVPDSNLFVPNGSLLGAFSPTTCDGTQYQLRNQSDFSAEIRLSSQDGSPLAWSIGSYFLDLERRVAVNLGYDRGLGITRAVYSPPGSANPTEQLSFDQFDTQVFAVFGSVDYDLTPDLVLSGALRWDREERKVENLVDPNARNQFVLGGNAPLNVGLLTGPIPDQERVFEQLQPKIALNYRPGPDLSLFANWGIGFKSGGFNNQGSAASIDLSFNVPLGSGLEISDDYDKEVSSAFEVGFKSKLFNSRLSLEGAAYYTDVEDMQFFEFFVGNFGILRVVSNIDKVRVKGFELGATLKVSDALSFYAAGNYTDSEIRQNSARPNTEGNSAPYISDYTLNFGADLSLPVNNTLDFTARTDVRVTGPTWFHTAQENTQPSLFNAILPLAGLPAFLGESDLSLTQRDTFTTVNLRLGIQSESFRIVAFADNVLEELYLDEVIPAPEFGGSFVSPGNRRSYGIELGFNF
jgi:iron complex outermembrane receptor protein